MTERTTGKRPAVALALGGLVVLLAAARIPLLVVDEQNSLASTVQALAIAVPFAAIGVLVAAGAQATPSAGSLSPRA